QHRLVSRQRAQAVAANHLVGRNGEDPSFLITFLLRRRWSETLFWARQLVARRTLLNACQFRGRGNGNRTETGLFDASARDLIERPPVSQGDDKTFSRIAVLTCAR